MDGILGLDQQVVCLHVVFLQFTLLASEQLRDVDFHRFCSTLSVLNLSGAIKAVVAHGTCALWPSFAYQALVDADRIMPSENLDTPSSCVDNLWTNGEWRYSAYVAAFKVTPCCGQHIWQRHGCLICQSLLIVS